MSESIRERLVGCWRLAGYDVTADNAAPAGAVRRAGHACAVRFRTAPPRRRADHDNDHLVTPAATVTNDQPTPTWE